MFLVFTLKFTKFSSLYKVGHQVMQYYNSLRRHCSIFDVFFAGINDVYALQAM